MAGRVKFEIREVKTQKEREGYDRVLLRAFRKEYGWDAEKLRTLDSYTRNERRFAACLLEGEPGRVIGTGMLAEHPSTGKHAALRLSVEEEFRGQGIARAIGERLLQEAKRMGLKEIITFCFESFLEVYARFGFRPVEKLELQPGENEHSYIIEKKLD